MMVEKVRPQERNPETQMPPREVLEVSRTMKKLGLAEMFDLHCFSHPSQEQRIWVLLDNTDNGQKDPLMPIFQKLVDKGKIFLNLRESEVSNTSKKNEVHSFSRRNIRLDDVRRFVLPEMEKLLGESVRVRLPKKTEVNQLGPMYPGMGKESMREWLDDKLVCSTENGNTEYVARHFIVDKSNKSGQPVFSYAADWDLSGSIGFRIAVEVPTFKSSPLLKIISPSKKELVTSFI